MYRWWGKAGGAGAGLAATGAPYVAVYVGLALALIVLGACVLRGEVLLRKSQR